MFRPYRTSLGAPINKTSRFPGLLLVHILIEIIQISKRDNINYKIS
jgi:hypothetical protein